MEHGSDEKFHVFVSHKQDDHSLAVTLKRVLEHLSGTIECFVSRLRSTFRAPTGTQRLNRGCSSRCLVLLFTEP